MLDIMKRYSEDQHINVGSGADVTIRELANVICGVVGFDGPIVQDLSKPDGTPRKLMAADKLRALGWKPSVSLPEGIARSYAWYLEHGAELATAVDA